MMSIASPEDWLWGWDTTPGIVSILAQHNGSVMVWRRTSLREPVVLERDYFLPWALISDLAMLTYPKIQYEFPEKADPTVIYAQKLQGTGALQWKLSCANNSLLERNILAGAAQRGYPKASHIGELSKDIVLRLPPEEQYLIASGRTYYKGLDFNDIRRLRFDIETTGLNPSDSHVFLIAIHSNFGFQGILDIGAKSADDAAAEKELLAAFCRVVQETDPDILENHNIHGFDLPFLFYRAQQLGVAMALGRKGAPSVLGTARGSARGYGAVRAFTEDSDTYAIPLANLGRQRYSIQGREIIDTLDAVRRFDFAARALPNHGLKDTAKYFGVAAPNRVYLSGGAVYDTWKTQPDAVRAYAMDDVIEAGSIAEILGGAAFALAKMAPRRGERAADAGPATGILEPMLLRAYLRAQTAIPAYTQPNGATHSGAATILFAAGVKKHVVKADVASLYPSLMRQFHIGSQQDSLGALLGIVDRLVEQRLQAKKLSKDTSLPENARAGYNSLSAAMKIIINSAYGYLGSVRLARFADMNAANEITKRGRDTLNVICEQLKARGAELIEADTDGVYFSVPESWSETEERAIVQEVDTLLPPLIHLEYEGRYAAMLSHEVKNYALLTYDDIIILKGVAFRSSKFEKFGADFLTEIVSALLRDNSALIPQIFQRYLTLLAEKALPLEDMLIPARLTKSSKEYLNTRQTRREAPYEAMLAAGKTVWAKGERIRFYYAGQRQVTLYTGADTRNYDVAYYKKILRNQYAAKLENGLSRAVFAEFFSPPEQAVLFPM